MLGLNWYQNKTNVMAWSTKGTFLLSLFGHVDEEKEDVNVHRQWQTQTDDNIPDGTWTIWCIKKINTW